MTVLMGRENVDGAVDAAPPGSQVTQSPNRSKGVGSDRPRAEPCHASSSAAMLKRVGPLWARALNPLSRCQTPSESTAAKRLLDCAKVYCLLGKEKASSLGRLRSIPPWPGAFTQPPQAEILEINGMKPAQTNAGCSTDNISFPFSYGESSFFHPADLISVSSYLRLRLTSVSADALKMDDSPKHLLWLVARSMKTLEEMTVPKGRNICMSSLSPNSCGRW